MENTRFPKKPFNFLGGIKPPHKKHTSKSESVILPLPDEIILPMSQHIGKPCVPTVAVGDKVNVGQTIGEPTGLGAPIHSSVSGVVKKIADIKTANGGKTTAVFIEPDGEQTVCPDLTPPTIDTRESLIEAIKNSGAVGLGGAGFPTYVKFNVEPGKVDTLIINASECEPYITSDHREILENSWEIMSGIYTLLDIFGFERIIIGIENNKPDAIKLLTDIAEHKTDKYDHVKVLKLKSRYPQGAEKMLIYACTGRIVPVGKLPSDVGCIVMNITTLSFITRYIKTGIPLVTKRITVDGSAVKNPGNFIVPIGTPIKYVLDYCGVENPKKVLMGGPMMGVAISDMSLPVLKQNNAILAFSEEDAILPDETECIKCGRCTATCPMKLEPTRIAAAAKKKDASELAKLNVMNCIECGSCTYVCPAKRFLTQQMRIGKFVLRSANNK